MLRTKAQFLSTISVVVALGCSNATTSPTSPSPQAADKPTSTPVVATAAATAPADDAGTDDLAARCEAVDWDGPRNADHLPPGLRAIATELTKKGPTAIPEIEEALPRSLNLRRTAPDVLYRWPSDKTRAILVKQLDDPDDQAAHHAAWALGVIGGPEVVQPLLDAASKPGSEVVTQVLDALKNLPSGTTDRAYDLLVSSLSSPSRWVRTSAAQALANVGRPDKLDEAIALAEKLAATETDAGTKAALQSTVTALRRKK